MPVNRSRTTSEFPSAAAFSIAAALGVFVIDPWADQVALPIRFFYWSAYAVAVLVWIFRTPTRLGDRPKQLRWWAAGWAGWVVAGCLAAVASEDPLVGLLGDPQRRMGVATWFVIGVVACGAALVFSRARDVMVLFRAMTVALLLQGLLALTETIGWSPYPQVSGTARAVGSLGNSGTYAALILVLFPASAATALFDEGRWRWLGSAAAVGGGLAIVASGTRSALVVFLIEVGVVVVLGSRSDGNRSPSRQSASTPHGRFASVATSQWWIAWCVLAGAGAAALLGLESLASRFGRSRGAFSTGLGRLDTWRLAVKLIPEHPIFGVGPEQFVTEFPSVITPAYEATYSRARVPDRAHNVLIDAWIATGTLGLIAFVGLVCIGLWLVRQGLRLGGPAPASDVGGRSDVAGGLGRRLTQFALLSAVAGLANELLLFPTLEVDPLLWLVFGAAVGMSMGIGRGSGIDRAGSRSGQKVGADRRSPLVIRIAVGSILLVTLAVGWSSVTGIRADRHVRAAKEQTVLYPVLAFDNLERAASLQPEASFHLLVGAVLARSTPRRDLHERSIGLMLDAVDNDPTNSYVQGSLADTYLSMAKRYRECRPAEEALTHIDVGLRYDPNSAKLMLARGGALFELGRFDEARAAWERSDELLGRFGAAKENLRALDELEAKSPPTGFRPCADG